MNFLDPDRLLVRLYWLGATQRLIKSVYSAKCGSCWCCLHCRMTISINSANKKVLLRERKRHTDRSGSSTPAVTRSGVTPLGGELDMAGVPLPVWTWPGYPPTVVDRLKTLPSLIHRMRSVKIPPMGIEPRVPCNLLWYLHKIHIIQLLWDQIF